MPGDRLSSVNDRGPQMSSVRWKILAVLAAVFILGMVFRSEPTRAHDPKAEQKKADVHVHVSVPAAYRHATAPAGLWTDPVVLARGRAIYETKCAVCHGRDGAGDGPAAAGLALKPPSL